jgi:hypothetical protein
MRAATIAAALACCACSTQSDAVAPRYLDLALVEGSTVPASCPILEDAPGTIQIGCVEAADIAAIESAYVQQMERDGWRSFRHDHGTRHLQRPFADGDCSELAYVSAPDGAESTIWFHYASQLACGHERPWLRPRDAI